MKIVYIAGPYFGDGAYEKIEENIRNAEKYQIQLANNGIGFFCPHNHTEHFEKKAKAEIEYATANNLKIFYPKSPEDMEDIILWARKEG